MSNVFLITNRKLINKNNDFFYIIEQAVNAGVDFIILREKDLCNDEIYNYIKKIKCIKCNKKFNLIINHGFNSFQIAEKTEADGCQFSFKDFIEKDIKSLKNKIIGVSVHNLNEAIECDKRGVDYILISHIYETNCKIGLKPKGLNFVKQVKENVKTKVIALGGINLNNALNVINAGADGIAVMSYIMSAENPYFNSLKLVKKVK